MVQCVLRVNAPTVPIQYCTGPTIIRTVSLFLLRAQLVVIFWFPRATSFPSNQIDSSTLLTSPVLFFFWLAHFFPSAYAFSASVTRAMISYAIIHPFQAVPGSQFSLAWRYWLFRYHDTTLFHICFQYIWVLLFLRAFWAFFLLPFEVDGNFFYQDFSRNGILPFFFTVP